MGWFPVGFRDVCCETLLHQLDIDIAGEAEEHVPWGADGFLPDSLDNIEYDAGAVERLRKMKKTAYAVCMALKVAVGIMFAAYSKGDDITDDMRKPIKLKVSQSVTMACMYRYFSMLARSVILSITPLIAAGGDRDGQGEDLGVLPGPDQLQPT